MVKAFVAACAVILSVTGCSDHVQRPYADGYTLHGVVQDAHTVTPVSDVTVLMSSGITPEFHEITVTDANGEFTLKPSPPTAPSSEILRFTKPGYAALEVPASTVTRLEEYRY